MRYVQYQLLNIRLVSCSTKSLAYTELQKNSAAKSENSKGKNRHFIIKKWNAFLKIMTIWTFYNISDNYLTLVFYNNSGNYLIAA